MELYATIFEEEGCLDRLESFASHFGADFYRIPRNESTITLVKEEWTIPPSLPFGDDLIVPFRAGEKCAWKVI